MKSVKLFLGLVLAVVAVSCGTPAPEQEVKVDSTVVVVDSTAVTDIIESVVAVQDSAKH
jgi:hypothetical protein